VGTTVVPANHHGSSAGLQCRIRIDEKAKNWCRRGESEFRPPLIPRNLLILQDDRNYKNVEFTQVGYTAGTRRF